MAKQLKVEQVDIGDYIILTPHAESKTITVVYTDTNGQDQTVELINDEYWKIKGTEEPTLGAVSVISDEIQIEKALLKEGSVITVTSSDGIESPTEETIENEPKPIEVPNSPSERPTEPKEPNVTPTLTEEVKPNPGASEGSSEQDIRKDEDKEEKPKENEPTAPVPPIEDGTSNGGTTNSDGITNNGDVGKPDDKEKEKDNEQTQPADEHPGNDHTEKTPDLPSDPPKEDGSGNTGTEEKEPEPQTPPTLPVQPDTGGNDEGKTEAPSESEDDIGKVDELKGNTPKEPNVSPTTPTEEDSPKDTPKEDNPTSSKEEDAPKEDTPQESPKENNPEDPPKEDLPTENQSQPPTKEETPTPPKEDTSTPQEEVPKPKPNPEDPSSRGDKKDADLPVLNLQDHNILKVTFGKDNVKANIVAYWANGVKMSISCLKGRVEGTKDTFKWVHNGDPTVLLIQDNVALINLTRLTVGSEIEITAYAADDKLKPAYMTYKVNPVVKPPVPVEEEQEKDRVPLEKGYKTTLKDLFETPFLVDHLVKDILIPETKRLKEKLKVDKLIPILFLDLETTGLSAKDDYLLEMHTIFAYYDPQEWKFIRLFEVGQVSKFSMSYVDLYDGGIYSKRIPSVVMDMHFDNGLWKACMHSDVDISGIDTDYRFLVPFGNLCNRFAKEAGVFDPIEKRHRKERIHLAGSGIAFDKTWVDEGYLSEDLKRNVSHRLIDASVFHTAHRLFNQKSEEVDESTLPEEVRKLTKHRAEYDINLSLYRLEKHLSKFMGIPIVPTTPDKEETQTDVPAQADTPKEENPNP